MILYNAKTKASGRHSVWFYTTKQQKRQVDKGMVLYNT